MLRLPPGPRDRLFGLTLGSRLQRNPLTFLCEAGQEFGDIAFWRIGAWRMALLNHPRYLREALLTQRNLFPKFKKHTDVLRQIAGNSLFVNEGEEWLRKRRLVQPAFARTRMELYAPQMVQCIQQQMAGWPTDRTFDLSEELHALTLRIIARSLFSIDFTGRGAAILEANRIRSVAMVREFGSVVKLPDWLPIPSKIRKRWAIRTLHAQIDEIIAERRRDGRDRGDILSMLLSAVDEEGDGRGLTNEQARNEALLVFNAGQDDTASSMGWVCWQLAQRPQLQHELAEQIEQATGGEPFQMRHLDETPLLEQVLKESMRLYPSTWCLTTREAIADVNLGDYDLPRGCWVFISPFALHRRADVFENPEVFDPARFTPERERQIPPMAYIPFGGGPRICAGQAFGMLAISLLVGTLLQRYRIGPPQAQVTPQPVLSLRLGGGLQVRLQSRAARPLSVA